jgi:hypothetical protein
VYGGGGALLGLGLAVMTPVRWQGELRQATAGS